MDAAREAKVMALVEKQANDAGCWFEAQTCAEAYLQRQLRLLHAEIEGTNFFGGKGRAACREVAMDQCRWCKREGHWPRICKSTRDMEERSHDPICDAELLKAGGGEYSHNQARATPPVGS